MEGGGISPQFFCRFPGKRREINGRSSRVIFCIGKEGEAKERKRFFCALVYLRRRSEKNRNINSPI